MTKRKRADAALVGRGLFESRARAQAAITAGLVTANGAVVRKSSDEIAEGAVLQASPEHPWVSRGALKLVAALDPLVLVPGGGIFLDVGACPGGVFRRAFA